MSINKIKFWLFIFQYVHCKLILNDFLEYSDFFITSSQISKGTSLEIVDKLRNESSIRFRIELESEKIYELVLNLKTSTITNDGTKILVYKKDEEVEWDVKNVTLVQGYVKEYLKSSSVDGQIKEVYFYGIIEILNTQYRVENLKSHPKIYSKFRNKNKNAVVFFNKNENVEKSDAKRHKKRSSSEISSEYKSFVENGKLCSLFVIIDNSFLKIIHESDVDSAIGQVITTLEAVDSIYRSADFDEDGDPDNIGFAIKFMIILESSESPANILLRYSDEPIDSMSYLNSISGYYLLNEVCLGVAFTAQMFKGGIIGLSFTAEADLFKFTLGGICDRAVINTMPLISLNTLVVSARQENGNIISQRYLEMSLAHELGHSFGSEHDSTPDCSGYLMSPNAPKELKLKHFHFSPCSKKTITKTILMKGYCLEDTNKPYCGNGIVEEGEVCDCGTKRDCEYFDACCLPKGRIGSCRLNSHEGYRCHPSQGLCCNNNCQFNDFSKYGLDCKNFHLSCPCKNSFASTCSCGLDGQCLNDTCHSEECARIGLTECECPSGCSTCCQFQNSCRSSYDITNYLVRLNHSLTIIGKKDKHSQFGRFIKFCVKNNCADLFFREAKPGEYCLVFGQLGRCDASLNKCIVPKPKRIFPSVVPKWRSGKNRRSCSEKLGWSKEVVVFISISFYALWLL